MLCRSESEREAKAAATMLTCLISCSKGNATVITGTYCARAVYADLHCLVAVMIAIIIIIVTTLFVTIIITNKILIIIISHPTLKHLYQPILFLRRNLTRSIDIAFNASTDMRYTVLTGEGSRRSDELHILRPLSHDSCTAYEYVHNNKSEFFPLKYSLYFWSSAFCLLCRLIDWLIIFLFTLASSFLFLSYRLRFSLPLILHFLRFLFFFPPFLFSSLLTLPFCFSSPLSFFTSDF